PRQGLDEDQDQARRVGQRLPALHARPYAIALPYEGSKMGPGSIIVNAGRQAETLADGLLGAPFDWQIEFNPQEDVGQDSRDSRPGELVWGKYGIAVSAVVDHGIRGYVAPILTDSWTVESTRSLRPVARVGKWDWVLDVGGGRTFRIPVEARVPQN
ncbi:hypothetical protein, partial [Phenylobacterium haematophilum]|uniref:hypothetical protein n=1 Tax=Phenylobacterium haematophilum TaxID=98513 RepID=UPI001C843700